jgi:hypothetical protein
MAPPGKQLFCTGVERIGFPPYRARIGGKNRPFRNHFKEFRTKGLTRQAWSVQMEM